MHTHAVTQPWSLSYVQAFQPLELNEIHLSYVLVIALLNGIHNSCTPLLVGTWEYIEKRGVQLLRVLYIHIRIYMICIHIYND